MSQIYLQIFVSALLIGFGVGAIDIFFVDSESGQHIVRFAYAICGLTGFIAALCAIWSN